MFRKATTSLAAVGLLVSALAACSAGAPPPGGTPAGGGGGTPPAQATPAGGGGGNAGGGGAGGGGTALIEAATAVKHACALLPTELVAAIVPDGSEPEEQQFPTQCSVYGEATAMEFTIAPYDTVGRVPPSDAEPVSWLGFGAWLQHLTKGNYYLTVLLSPDGDQGALYAEVSNQDGKDHKSEVIDLARAVLDRLQ